MSALAKEEIEPAIDEFEFFYHRGYGKAWVNASELPVVRDAEKQKAQNAWQRFINRLDWHRKRIVALPQEPLPQETDLSETPILRLIPGGPDVTITAAEIRLQRHADISSGLAYGSSVIECALELARHDKHPPDIREIVRELKAQVRELEAIARR